MTVVPIASFEEYKKIIDSGKPVVIEFYATWCPLCKPMVPIFETLAQDVPGVAFYKVDIDAQPRIAQSLEVQALPRFTLFKNKMKLDDVTGADPHGVLTLIKQAERLVLN